MTEIHPCGGYLTFESRYGNIAFEQSNTPLTLLSREAEGPALRSLGNQLVRWYGANSGRSEILEDESSRSEIACLFLSRRGRTV